MYSGLYSAGRLRSAAAVYCVALFPGFVVLLDFFPIFAHTQRLLAEMAAEALPKK